MRVYPAAVFPVSIGMAELSDFADHGGLPRLYTLSEVAALTGFALRTLQRDCRAGKITHVHRGRDRLMTREQVEMLINRHTAQAAQPELPFAADDQALLREQAARRRWERKIGRAS